MTRDEWAELQWEASDRATDAQYKIPRHDAVSVHIIGRLRSREPFVPPPAGSWVRSQHGWHRFDGDVAWRPIWRGPALVLACGARTAPVRDVGELHAVAAPPAGATVCAECARAA
jgi:hypothetical protein